jgi:hypothetical protein
MKWAPRPMLIKISGNVPPDAKYIGSTACIECHEDQKHITKTLHRLGMTVIGKPSKLQDHSRFPEFNKGLDKLMAGTKFWFHGFDKGRGFDKYQIATKAPADAASASFTATSTRIPTASSSCAPKTCGTARTSPAPIRWK